MSKNKFKSFVVAPATATFLATGAAAGGLSDAIVESEVLEMQEEPEGSLPGWVLPAIALVVIGAAIASSDDDDDEADTASGTMTSGTFTFTSGPVLGSP